MKLLRAPAMLLLLLLAVMGGLTVILKLSAADPQLTKNCHCSTLHWTQCRRRAAPGVLQIPHQW